MIGHIIFLSVLFAVNCSVNIYVSSNGNDAWTGSTPNPGSQLSNGPLKTIQQAQKLVRYIRSQNRTFSTPITVSILPGIYPLSAPLLFSPQDSGTPSSPTIYTTFVKGKVSVSSCKPITAPWTKITRGSDTLYRTTIPEVKSGQYNPNSLFINGKRRPRARSPLRYWAGLVPALPNNAFLFSGNDLRQYNNLQDANIVLYHSWTASRHFINSVNVDNKTVILSNPTNSKIGWHEVHSGHRYYIENVLEELDEQGEWYLDRTTGELTYWPYVGETLDLDACFPTLLELVKMIGNATHSVHDIAFQDVTFEYSDWYMNRTVMADFQAAAWLNTSAIYLQNTKDVTFAAVTVQHVGFYGIQVHGGCTNIAIDNCQISDIGAGGVRIGETVTSTTPTSHVTVTNNHITDGGKVFKEGIGIIIHRSSDNKIDHNFISFFYYTGISVGWSWGYYPADGSYRNQVTNNVIDQIGRHELCDMGGIYTLGMSNGTIIDGNKISNVFAFYIFDWGIYLDEGTSNVRVSNNKVYNTGSAGFFQHYGQNNLVTMNYFEISQTKDGAISLGMPEDHLCYSFVNNTVVHGTSGMPLITENGGGTTVITNKQYFFDQNTYYHCEFSDPLIVEVHSPKTYRMTFKNWQKEMQQDIHSTVKPC